MYIQTIGLWITLYIIVVLLLIRWTNKISKDSYTVLTTVYNNLNQYFLSINKIINNQRENLEKFDELIEIIYAKKKWFIHNKTHTIADQYELFLWLQDTIEYLSEYCNEDYDNKDLYKKTESLYWFLFSIKNRQSAIRWLLAVSTLWLWLWFVQDPAPL